jgi:hypothetical protein
MTEPTPQYTLTKDPQTGNICMDAEELEKWKRQVWAMVAAIGRVEGVRYKIIATKP